MSEVVDEKITCDTCTGVCCTNVRVQLTEKAANRLIYAGTRLITILDVVEQLELDGVEPDESESFCWSNETDMFLKRANSETDPDIAKFWLEVALQARQMRPGEGLFVIDGDCGFLQADKTCGDYENRPPVCREFKMGGVICQSFRQGAGIDVPVELTTKPVVQ